MNTELNKINYFFEEGKRLWNVDHDRVATREFYELWENVQMPQPFSLECECFELFDIDFELPSSDESPIGWYRWLPDEKCPALVVETAEWEKKYLLSFDDGEPHVHEEEAVSLEKDGMTTGEKLELTLDVIAQSRKDWPDKDIFTLTKKEFIQLLDLIAENHPPRNIAAMKRLSAVFIKNLLKKAAADMATDELSSQLSLPLGGDYSTGDHHDADDFINLPSSQFTPGRSPWQVAFELGFLSEACRLAMENEQHFVLTFDGAVTIGRPGGRDVPLKLKTDPEIPLSQGDILNVYIRGEKELFGTFKIDIFDGDTIYGRLRCDAPLEFENCRDKLFARLQRSPRSYLSERIARLHEQVSSANQPDALPGASGYVLGSKDFTTGRGDNAGAPTGMDASQQAAWALAVNPDNPLVLIQGPPGTGKTYVLEQIVRELCRQGLRILIAAPSNIAVDNICRRIADMPALRFGNNPQSIAGDVVAQSWIGDPANVARFIEKRRELKSGGIYAGTHIGLLRDNIVTEDMEQNGIYDAIIFDEAGMANLEELLLCATLGKRAILLGDHRQLPPFPMPAKVLKELETSRGRLPRQLKSIVAESALEWLVEWRKIPVLMLQRSYRCHNPRLLRFASTLFYDAGVKASSSAEYFRLNFHERKVKYPPSTLRFFSTSGLSPVKHKEYLFFEGQKPGLANPVEACICLYAFYQAVKKYPLEEISIIAPYRKQINILRENISLEYVRQLCPEEEISDERWTRFVSSRIATVDSFQGGESDIVIICYVRSNLDDGIGFIDNPNRINVAHTRCRREIVIVGDLNGLKRQAGNNIFDRMERAFRRDGELIFVNDYMMREIAALLDPTLKEHNAFYRPASEENN